ncbi:general transcription factor IIF subunit 2-like [Anticarsia gemmatalis]|uniref:general transcription factor IIF subunit 2-like n=1 Tax=Anticarsia gemmatalis TaxID=129554 RepID=UPI003F76D13A
MSDSNNRAPHIDRELDLSNTGRGAWLVKVPKYIANKWEKAQGNIEVGKLKISRAPGQRAQVQLSLSEAVLCLKDAGEQNIPKEHHLDVTNVSKQSLGVFSQVISTPSSIEAEVPKSGKLYMEGGIIRKLECRVKEDTKYNNLKSETIKDVDSSPQVPKLPRSRSLNTIISCSLGASGYRKTATDIRSRYDKEAIRNMLFAAFQKHQCYNIKDLQKITRQPIFYLKEILKEVCNFNLKNPHKNMWVLKPEYRQHKKDQTAESKVDNNSSDGESVMVEIDSPIST